MEKVKLNIVLDSLHVFVIKCPLGFSFSVHDGDRKEVYEVNISSSDV